MAHPQAGIIERASGKLLRWLMAYLFLVGVTLSLFLVYLLVQELPAPPASGWVGFIWVGITPMLMMVPYLVIRYRDPDSTTIPFQNQARGLFGV